MAANRKLQTEIQQVLKKMDEGVVLFDEIWEKVYTADTQPLKEKFEADLKKEIKKLQRLRDQIKIWIGSNEIKDKTALVEARKTIESKMEQFKVCERDTKTKAYSKEGLARDAKLDPKEALREEKRNWLNECLDNINDLNNTVEAEKEKLSAGKGKSKNKDELMRLENRLQKQKWHIAKLELIIKLIDNEELDPASLDSIKDSVEYYIETAQDDDGQLGVEHEFDIYEDLALDSFSVGPATFDLPRSTTQDDTPPNPGPAAAPVNTAAPGLTPPVTTITNPGTNSTVAVTSKTTTIIEHKAPPKEIAPKDTTADSTSEKRTGPAPSVAQIVKGGAKAAAPETTTTSSIPPPPGIVPAAGAKSTVSDASDSKSSKAASETSPRPNAKAEPAPAKATAPAAKATAPAKTTAPATSTATSSPAPPANSVPATANSKTSAAPTSQTPAATTSAPNTAANTAANTPASTAPQATPTANISAQSTPASTATNATSTSGPPAGLTPNLTGALPPPTTNSNAPLLSQQQQQQQQQLLQQQQAAVAPAPALAFTAEQMQTLALLKQSAMYMPEEFQYIPRTPNPLSHPAFPSTPICTNHSEYAALFEKLPLDTMFFAFYHQQNSFQQTLAAKRLKKNSWRYHKKYVTWFQRHSEPKMATQDFEEGTYLYFDYDGGIPLAFVAMIDYPSSCLFTWILSSALCLCRVEPANKDGFQVRVRFP